MPEKSPLHNVAARAGATFVEEGGSVLAGHFGDSGREYWAACRAAVLFDVSHRGRIEVFGPEARSFLHNLCTNDILHLEPRTGCEAFFTNAKAKIVAHTFVYRISAADQEDRLWLDVDPGIAARLLQHLDHHRISEQVEFADRTPECIQLYLAGPQASAVLGKVFQRDIPAEGKQEELLPPTGLDAAAQVRRHVPLNLPGFDIVYPSHQAEELWSRLVEAGALPAGIEAYQTLRVEAGTAIQGKDFDENNLVMEVGRTRQAICYTKGCFLGQEPIVRARDIGHVNRSLVGLKLHGPAAAIPGTKLFRGGVEVGQITSSVLSPRLGTAVALAYVRRGHQESGTILDDAAAGGRPFAEVASLPLVGSARPVP
jgi:folate-binding protein YgfZ